MKQQSEKIKKPGLSVSGVVMPLAKRWRWVLVLVIGLTLFFARAIPSLRIENDLMYMLPEDNPAKRLFMDSQETFGNSTGIVLVIETPEDIYRPDYLNRIKLLCNRLIQANVRILAGQMENLLPLENSQSMVLAAYLQSRTGDTDFTASKFQDVLKDPEGFLEALEDALPAFIQDKTGTACEGAARALCDAVAHDPSMAERVHRLTQQTTDRRKHYRNLWVDQVVSLTETDTVWPEFTDMEDLHGFAQSLSIPVNGELNYFLSDILEGGLQDGSAVINRLKTGAKELAQAGISPSFQAMLKQRLNPKQAAALINRVRSAPKQIRVGKLVQFSENGEVTNRDRYLLKLRLHIWDFFREGLFSQDEHNALILVRTAPNLDRDNRALLLKDIKQVLGQVFDKTHYRIYQAGEPVVDEAVGQLMIEDVSRLLPVVIGVVMLFLLLSFRNLPGVAYPLMTVLLSLLWCLGTMAYAHIPISIVSTVLPVLLVAVGSAYGIHLIHYFANEPMGSSDRQTAGRSTLDIIGSGVLMAGLTTVAGFGSLGFNRIIPLRDFGLFIGLGVFYALLLSLTLVMALLMRFGISEKKRSTPKEKTKSHTSFPTRMLEYSGRFAVKRPWTLILVYVGFMALSIWGMLNLKVEMNNISFFKPHAPIRMADDYINQNFSGTVGMSIIFSGPSDHGVLSFDVLKTIERLSEEITQRHPEVGKVMSVVDFIKKMNQTFFYNDPEFYRIPELGDLAGEKSPEALKRQYMAYLDKYRRTETRSFIDDEKQEMVLTVQIKTGSSKVVSRIIEDVEEQLQGPLGDPLRTEKINWRTTGIGSLYLEANDLIVFGQLRSIIISLVIVFVLVSLVMGSLAFGLLSIVPLTVTILFNFGLMGLFDFPLDAGTAITACIAIGIGIDYAIHYVNRYRICRNNGLTHQAACLKTAVTSGQAIWINALAVTSGFLVLLLSSFVPLVNLGILISATMISAALGSMLLIPAVLTLLEKRKKARTGGMAGDW